MTGQLSRLSDAEEAVLADRPPSAKLVALALLEDGAMTQSELADETLLPRRTVREAVGGLEEAGLVTARPSVMDARTVIYSLDVDARASEPRKEAISQ